MTGAELRTWREHWRLSQTQLADMLGIHYQTLGRWEAGQREVPPFLPLALETLSGRLAAELVVRARGPQPNGQT